MNFDWTQLGVQNTQTPIDPRAEMMKQAAATMQAGGSSTAPTTGLGALARVAQGALGGYMMKKSYNDAMADALMKGTPGWS